MLLGARNYFTGRKAAGRLVEIEYLQSLGTRYIDTGIDCSALDFVLTARTTRDGFAMGWVHQSAVAGTWIGFSSRGGFGVFYNNVNASASLTSYFPDAQPHTVAFDAKSGVYVDGVKKKSFTARAGTDSLVGKPLFLFDPYCFKAGGPEYANNITWTSPGVIYGGATLVVGGETVRDYMTMRDGATGGLYDRVSQTFFPGEGVGDFVLGPDKAGGGNSWQSSSNWLSRLRWLHSPSSRKEAA